MALENRRAAPWKVPWEECRPFICSKSWRGRLTWTVAHKRKACTMKFWWHSKSRAKSWAKYRIFLATYAQLFSTVRSSVEEKASETSIRLDMAINFVKTFLFYTCKIDQPEICNCNVSIYITLRCTENDMV